MEDKFQKIITRKAGMPWEAAIEELRQRREVARQMGGKERVDRQHKEGKLTIRERIEKLVDKDSFFEIGSLIGKSEYDENGDQVAFTPAGYVTGLAEIDGRQVTIGGDDFTVAGGSESSKRADFFMQPMSTQYGIPAINLCDGAGANTADYEERGRMRLPASQVGWWWCTQTLQKVPVVSALLGPCAGGTAGHAALSHFSVMVKGIAQIFPSGPPLVSRSLSYRVAKDDLGGSKMHVHQTGVIDNEAEDEEDCFRQIRQFLSYMPNNIYEVPVRKDMGDTASRREEELLGIVPVERKKPYNMYKVIRLLVDKGEFFEMRKYYGSAIITVFARMDGYVVGIVASNPMVNAGGINGHAAQKMARFIDLCCFFNIPVVLLVDVPGLMIGIESEKTGTVRYGMAAVMAACEATVPKVQINLRKAYGIGSGAFNSVGGMLNLSLRLAWPSGEWGPIPVEGGVAAAYRRQIESVPDPEAKRKEIEDRLLRLRSPFLSAEAGDIMDIIDPRDTRPIICRFIKAAQPVLHRNATLPKRSVRPA
ncbi:acyl-CoA carboxylase subunit beta [Chloroflexota bacterium]